jgi:hypothetical protein
MGDEWRNPSKLAQAMMGGVGGEANLQKIIEELESLKKQRDGSGEGTGKGDQYKYLDDKTLYSSDG